MMKLKETSNGLMLGRRQASVILGDFGHQTLIVLLLLMLIRGGAATTTWAYLITSPARHQGRVPSSSRWSNSHYLYPTTTSCFSKAGCHTSPSTTCQRSRTLFVSKLFVREQTTKRMSSSLLQSTSSESKTISSKNEKSNDFNTHNDDAVMFGKFIIPGTSVFYQSSSAGNNNDNVIHSIAFVNLRPIVPGHVLVIPKRVTAHMEDLTDAEYTDLWNTVRVVQRILKVKYPNCSGYNVAVQDGKAAGQSVPHVHVHVLPRRDGDYERNDDIYNDIEEWAPRNPSNSNQSTKIKLDVPDDHERRDRTIEEMAEEAESYRAIVSSLLVNE